MDTIPRLFRSKRDVIEFFRGAGVPDRLTADLLERVKTDRSNITKFEIARTVLARLNSAGDARLRERREVIRRIVEIENYSSCWPEDQLKAKGLVSEVREIVNVRDSFTRMDQERQRERNERIASHRAELEERQRRRQALSEIRNELYSLFLLTVPSERGKRLEGILNRLFATSGILVREAFARVGIDGEGVIEQIDGVVEIAGDLYLVEMKWWSQPLGVGEVSQHLVRVFSRDSARGILISNPGFTEPAVTVCREALSKMTVALCTLEEIVWMLEEERDLAEILKVKIQAAIIDKNPLHRSWR